MKKRVNAAIFKSYRRYDGKKPGNKVERQKTMDVKLLEKARAIMCGATQLKPSATPMASGRPPGLNAQERELPLAAGNASMFSQLNNMAADRPAPAIDPLLSVEQWYPEFHRLHMQIVAETPEFDYGWLRQNRRDLYRQIKVKENEIDALGAAPLSQVMALLREWRELILTAEFERQQFTR